MGGTVRAAVAAVLIVAGPALWACDRGASNAARDHAADENSTVAASPYGATSNLSDSRRSASDWGGAEHTQESRASVPLVDGKPMWSDNRRHSAEENADYHFHRDGADFGAATEKDYLAKVHRFIDHPPSDVETIKRSNGDELLYDPKTNTFAVERKDGAPRTMFKPRDGAAYWKEQQAKAASGDDSYGGRSSARSSSNDEG